MANASPAERGLSARTCARERVRFSVAPARAPGCDRRFDQEPQTESPSTEMMEERAREEHFENPARPIPQRGCLAGKAVGCPTPANPLCGAVRGEIVPAPSSTQKGHSLPARQGRNGSSGSRSTVSTIDKSPPRPKRTSGVPRSTPMERCPRNAMDGAEIPCADPPSNPAARLNQDVHVNTDIVPNELKGNRGEPQ